MQTWRGLFPGILVTALIALASRFISDHYGAPTMLMALLFGIALNFLPEDPRCREGIVLRFEEDSPLRHCSSRNADQRRHGG